jgi:hypothetical protein
VHGVCMSIAGWRELRTCVCGGPQGSRVERALERALRQNASLQELRLEGWRDTFDDHKVSGTARGVWGRALCKTKGGRSCEDQHVTGAARGGWGARGQGRRTPHPARASLLGHVHHSCPYITLARASLLSHMSLFPPGAHGPGLLAGRQPLPGLALAGGLSAARCRRAAARLRARHQHRPHAPGSVGGVCRRARRRRRRQRQQRRWATCLFGCARGSVGAAWPERGERLMRLCGDVGRCLGAVASSAWRGSCGLGASAPAANPGRCRALLLAVAFKLLHRVVLTSRVGVPWLWGWCQSRAACEFTKLSCPPAGSGHR